MSKYQVTVISVSDQIVPLVKSLRLVANNGLKDAKRLSDYLVSSSPCILVAGINEDLASHVVGILREAGAEAIAEESTISTPMLLCPTVNEKRVWHWLTGPTTRKS